MKAKEDNIVCKICGRECKTFSGLGHHIVKTHKISTKQYYNIYLRKESEGMCVCGKEASFGGLAFGYHGFCSKYCFDNFRRGKTYEELFGKERAKEIKEKLSKSLRKFQDENLEYTHEVRSKAGKLGFKSLEENNPEALHRIKVLGAIAVHKKYPDMARNNLPNPRLEYDGHYFWSKQEIECYKYLVNLEVNFIPHFRIGGKEIDFFIENKLFWEHHPIPGMKSYGETNKEYYQRRRQLLDTNGYQDYKLIVTTSLKEMDIIERELNG
ncbi:hypothetical protein KAW18_02375 [candidate division WOR-3 bacterium]|nr:hypothetical protein [candidate division WOR-3 bacterium]